MTNVSIKYNPYRITTDVIVNGKKPKADSSLNFGNKRIQEWVEKLPEILIDEYRDTNISIVFTGIEEDYEDVQLAFEPYKDQITVQWIFHKTANILDVEESIERIFAEIQQGSIPELKDPSIIEAFQKAQNSQFKINVVATMSSGKSTLINALLGKQLMPAANQATTATIVEIIDTDQENFSATAYNKSGNKIKELDNVTLEDMKALNDDKSVTFIEIQGKIPFVSSVGKMKLVLVDTPGPNNSRDKDHEEMTYRMLKDSDKSLILYVMNAGQLGINDEKIFLDYICECMKSGGKQARDRYIFTINKMDAFSPKKEGTDCIVKALDSAKKGLEERGIDNPNIFPVTAGVALEKRTKDEEPMYIETFRRGCGKYEALHFEDYYKYSHLPQIAKQRIEMMKEHAKDDDLLEIHTGITSIEQAICMYINKYARPTKINDLVQSFNSKLDELAAFANLEEAIRNDKNKKAELDKQIQQVKANIKAARQAQTCTKVIENINFDKAITMINSRINEANLKIKDMISLDDNLVLKEIAQQKCLEIEKKCQAIDIQIKVDIENIFAQTYKEIVDKIIDEYKRHLSVLNIGVDSSAYMFNPIHLVSGSLTDLSQILKENIQSIDEGHFVQESYQKRKDGGFMRKVAHVLIPIIPDHSYETAYRNVWRSKYVDKVDMNDVSEQYLIPFRKHLQENKVKAIDGMSENLKRLKEYMMEEWKKIDNLLEQKLNDLSLFEVDTKVTIEEIASKEKNLKWLKHIQSEINNLIEF